MPEKNYSLDFRLGHVERVYTSKSDSTHPLTKGNTDSQLVEFSPVGGSSSTKPRESAIPLLRGISDSITRGDLILYTVLNERIFYLGPVNTKNNPSRSADHIINKQAGISKLPFSSNKDEADGYNVNIPKVNVPKLSKPRFNIIDFPGVPASRIDPTTEEYLESNFSDLQLEGRYGNAIRIGARNRFPQVIVSNNNKRNLESLTYGSVIAMTSMGKIEDNFPLDRGFILSCDFGNNILPERDPRSIRINSGNDKTSEDHTSQNLFNYRYAEALPTDGEEIQTEDNQIIINSDRIIFNSKSEDITLSSNRNINFGAGGNFTVANKGYSVFESRNIYIGNKAKERQEPMVLGEELRKLLVRILGLLANAQALGDYNVPQPLTVFPNVLQAGSLRTEVDNIMKEFNLGNYLNPDSLAGYETNVEDGKPVGDSTTGEAKFFSKHHFIEPNRT